MTSLTELLPHSGSMLLLQEVVSFDERELTAALTVTESSTFCEQSGVPSWVGIEYMAQAVAAWSGTQETEKDKGPKVGFLLAVREYSSQVPLFALGQRLEIRVRAVDKHGPMGVFEGEIMIDEETVARGNLSVYEGEPPNAAKGDKP